MTTHIEHRPEPPSIVALGTLSGLACFLFFWGSYQLSTWLARAFSSDGGPLALPRSWVEQIEPVKWIGGLLVVIVALLVTHAWDRLRVRYRLDIAQYWTMIGLALAICLLGAVLSGGF
jgi:hypothetical protein